MKGGDTGVETPVIPDEPDVLGADDVVEGVGADGLATGSSSCGMVFQVCRAVAETVINSMHRRVHYS